MVSEIKERKKMNFNTWINTLNSEKGKLVQTGDVLKLRGISHDMQIVKVDGDGMLSMRRIFPGVVGSLEGGTPFRSYAEHLAVEEVR